MKLSLLLLVVVTSLCASSAAGSRRNLLAFNPLLSTIKGAQTSCPKNGVPVLSQGFTSSPWDIDPFTITFKNPPVAKPVQTVVSTVAGQPHAIDAYELDIKAVEYNLTFKGAPRKTWFVGYDGQVPGPSFHVKRGRETLVRFHNKVRPGENTFVDKYWDGPHEPCEKGHPFAIHLHGQMTLAVWDGWANDEICLDEFKDYHYPNNEIATFWYHDHAVGITSNNAFGGCAGMYIVHDKLSEPAREGDLPACGEPWGLEKLQPDGKVQAMEEWELILRDLVVDKNAQLFFDKTGMHEKNLFGDVNLVSGIPWPKFEAKRKQYRMRFLNAATSRPYLVKIKDSAGNNVHQNICYHIGTDDNLRPSVTPMEDYGLLIGVAERYQIVCDFSSFKDGEKLYLLNDWDDKAMIDVAYFCKSHLLGRIDIQGEVIADAPFLQGTRASPRALPTPRVEDDWLAIMGDDGWAKAQKLAAAGTPHRVFKFERGNGKWLINGVGWEQTKIAAKDVEKTSWEVWELSAGGGWFHPVHIHLVSFRLISCKGRTLKNYEKNGAKDVFYVQPGNTCYVVARFGPNNGDYMFHCHNLVHEDNDMMQAFSVRSNTGTGPNRDSRLALADDAAWDLPGLSERKNKFHSNERLGKNSLVVPTDRELPEGQQGGQSAEPESLLGEVPLDEEYLRYRLGLRFYSMYYPTCQDPDSVIDEEKNPWKATCTLSLEPGNPLRAVQSAVTPLTCSAN